MFDIHPDGDRFGIAPVPDASDAGRNHVTLILDFFDELKRLASPRRTLSRN
jgi:hypothetical protein